MQTNSLNHTREDAFWGTHANNFRLLKDTLLPPGVFVPFECVIGQGRTRLVPADLGVIDALRRSASAGSSRTVSGRLAARSFSAPICPKVRAVFAVPFCRMSIRSPYRAPTSWPRSHPSTEFEFPLSSRS